MRKRYISIISLIMIFILTLTCIGCSDDSVDARINNHSMPTEKSNELVEITQQPELMSDTTISTTVALLPWYDYPAKPELENFTGLYNTDAGWAYLKNGVIDFSYNGYAENDTGTYYVKDGFIDWGQHYEIKTTTTRTYRTTYYQDSNYNNNNSTQYIANRNTGKIHYPNCKEVKKMKDSNKVYVNSIGNYQPCKVCNPS